jgi:methionyl-tRNA formyltransferase
LADGTLLRVHAAAVAPAGEQERHAARGREHGVRASAERLLLDCSDGALELLVVQPPGGRAMDAAAYLRGHRAAVG